MGLEGKKVLITGGTSGIGYSTARLFLERGAEVTLTGRDPERLQAAASSLKGEVLALQADVRLLPNLERLRKETSAAYGHLDVLFAIAGVALGTPLETTDEARFCAVMDSNVKGVFFTVQAIAPLMERGSSMILNTSWLADVGTAPLSVLSASKAAVRSFTRTFAAELLPTGIRVNAVSPGATDTPIHGTGRMTEAGARGVQGANEPVHTARPARKDGGGRRGPSFSWQASSRATCSGLRSPWTAVSHNSSSARLRPMRKQAVEDAGHRT